MDKFEENIMFFVHDTFFYKDIIDSLPMCIATINSEGKIYYVNKGWKDFFEKFADMDDSDFYGEDLALLFEEIFIDDQDANEVILRLKDAINSKDPLHEIEFDVVVDKELMSFRLLVFNFYEVNERRGNSDKIIFLERKTKKL